MKTLKDHIILYDAVCPLCNAYTGAFVRSGLLDANGRATYQGPHACAIDPVRAADEIALVNTTTGAVHYGIDSLFTILGYSFPALQPIFRNRAFAWAMRRLYRLISFNRRVIMPARDASPMQPSLHRGYRIAWILIAWLLTATILHRYSHLMTPLVPAGTFWREYAVCGGQLLWQGLVIRFTNRDRTLGYLGTMMTVSLGGALLLLPALIAGTWIHQPYLFTGWFLLVAGLMLLEHMRRTRVMGLSPVLSATWVLYRILLLFFIL